MTIRPAKPRPTWPQVFGGLLAAAGLGCLALMGVAAARFIVDWDVTQPFFERFPGEYAQPSWAPVGIPIWANWAHFLNAFFMLLVIRTGIAIRQQHHSKLPPRTFWVSRKNKRLRMPIAVHSHMLVDIAWVANGVLFVLLLAMTGQWVRIVPTSWEVFPNALSAALQYASLDWPVHDSWKGYNSLQQLSYFGIVLIVAPLAALSGWRLWGRGPNKVPALLDRVMPYSRAERIHFPVMLVFIAFIIVHVGLVFLTGWQANLNHMYAASDATTGAAAWAGTVMFGVSLIAFAIGWFAIGNPRFNVWLGKRTGEVLER